jgi:hypothetical protein
VLGPLEGARFVLYRAVVDERVDHRETVLGWARGKPAAERGGRRPVDRALDPVR